MLFRASFIRPSAVPDFWDSVFYTEAVTSTDTTVGLNISREVSSPAHLAAYDAGAGAGIYDISRAATLTAPQMLYPGAVSMSGTTISLDQSPWAVGIAPVTVTIRVMLGNETVATALPYEAASLPGSTLRVFADALSNGVVSSVEVGAFTIPAAADSGTIVLTDLEALPELTVTAGDESIIIDDVDDPTPPAAPAASPVLLEVSRSGTNAPVNSFNALNPLIPVGSLVTVTVFNDRDAAGVGTVTVTPASSGSPPTVTQVPIPVLNDVAQDPPLLNFDDGNATINGHSGRLFYFIATEEIAAGNNITCSNSGIAEQYGVIVRAYEPNTFDPTTPLVNVEATRSTADVTTVPSAAFTAATEDGQINFDACVPFEPFDIGTPPTGWTAEQIDIGAIIALSAQRTALTTTSEAVAATNFPISSGDHPFIGITYVIAPYVPPSSPVVTPVLLGTEHSGTNSAVTSYTATNPAYSAGDLVLVSVSMDSDLDRVIPVTVVAPNGETVTKEVDTTDDGNVGTAGHCITLFSYIATAAQSSGANIQCNSGSQAEQFAVTVKVFDAGTFDPTTPLVNKNTTASASAVANAPTAAFTAAVEDGMIVFFACTAFEPIGTAPAGWTGGGFDVGAIATYGGQRTALTTSAESVSAVNFPITVSSQPFVAVTAVVAPFPGA